MSTEPAHMPEDRAEFERFGGYQPISEQFVSSSMSARVTEHSHFSTDPESRQVAFSYYLK